MTIIDLHFLPHLAAANLAGTKTRTTRIKQHGKPGDIFFYQGVAFVITRIETERLIDAAYHYKEEGYKEKIDFISELKRIYPELQYEAFMWMTCENGREGQKYCMDPLTDEQQKRYEERIRKRYNTILYAHHYQKYGHVDITAIGGIPSVYWHGKGGEL